MQEEEKISTLIRKLENTLKLMEGKDFSKFKNELSDVMISTICPIGKKINSLKKDKTYLLNVLKLKFSKFGEAELLFTISLLYKNLSSLLT